MVVRCWPVWGSQIRTVPSRPALASSSFPATVIGHTNQTPPWWPSMVVRCWPVRGSQIQHTDLFGDQKGVQVLRERATESGTTTSRPPCNSAPQISHTEKSNAYE